MALEHDFFGVIDDDASGGLRWSDTAELGDQVVELELRAADASAVTDATLALTAAMVHALEGFDARARDALIAQLSERESATTQYVDHSVDTMGESLLDLLVHNSGDIAMDVLRSLQLGRVWLHPDRDADGDPFAVFEYSIGQDDGEFLLIVSFDIQGDVVAVDTTG